MPQTFDLTAVAPILAGIVEGSGESSGKSLTKLQVDAKDALYIMLDFASGQGKAIAERALIDWSVKDYNQRALAGQYNIKSIIKKIGPRAAEGLIPILAMNEVAIRYVAELIREVGDPPVLAKASASLASQLLQNIGKIQEIHLIAAAIIGGAPIADALLKIATDRKQSDELQRYALRAFSDSVTRKAVTPTDEEMNLLCAMAENPEFDKYQREETYYVIAQVGRKEDIKRLRKLLAEEDSFWQAVGFRSLLRSDGEGQLRSALQELDQREYIEGEDEVNELISRIASFPKLLPIVRSLLAERSAAIRGIAVGVIAKIGQPEDQKALIALGGDKARLPKGFVHKTVGEAAKNAAETIKKRG